MQHFQCLHAAWLVTVLFMVGCVSQSAQPLQAAMFETAGADEMTAASTVPQPPVPQAQVVQDTPASAVQVTEALKMEEAASADTPRQPDVFDEQGLRVITVLPTKLDDTAVVYLDEYQIENMLISANALRKEQKYDEALILINKVLKSDPDNYAAQAMKQIIQDSTILTRTIERDNIRTIRRRPVGD